jgi:aspartyl-tRNA(Asn)/glutamyl-tRNA(Gln) amidotransferase subunit A
MTGNLWQRSACELAALLASREVTPSELLRACVARNAQCNPGIGAVVTLCEQEASAAALEADERQRTGRRLSAIDGIPVTVKDSLYVRGVRVTWGSRLFADFVPEHDDICVERVRAAGAIVLGMTNTPELALTGYTDNPLFGPTRNPWNLALTPGGSSGGAVASVAVGITPFAIGTDAGGSIRTPASYTGLVGVRPSTARIPRGHSFPPVAYDFQVVTPVARTVGDAILLYDALAGPHVRDPESLRFPRETPVRAPKDTRILLVTDVNGEPVDPEIRANVQAAARVLASLGYQVETGKAPYDLEEVREVYATLSAVGAARVLANFTGWRDKVGANVVTVGETGLACTATDFVNTLDRLAGIRASVAEAWHDYDVVCTPTAATLAFPLGRSHPETIDGRPANLRSASLFTTWVGAIGHPAITVPVEPSIAGLPIGMQLVGRFGAERTLYDIAARYEEACPWSTRWPAFAMNGTG